MEDETERISWKIIDKYFKDNKDHLVKHHLDSYNNLFNTGIHQIFRENNPIKLMKEEIEGTKDFAFECHLYLGGKNGKKIYYGKPIIYDDNDNTHFMYPNKARLRNMTYGFSIHYDVDVEFIIRKINVSTKKIERIERPTLTLKKIFLGRFPIMLQSNYCILNGFGPEARFNMGECRNDPGGYFIVDGKEKVIVCQEKFGNNLLYIRDKVNDMYSHSADIKTVSEDPSKPKRTLSVRIVAPTSTYSNNQIVVAIPNVRKPIPLFILMRALGIISDKDIIKTCLLDMENNDYMIDLFIPSVHDAGMVFTQDAAIKYIASFTKGKTVASVMDILMNYFLPNIGELNFNQKAFYVGYMVYRLLLVYTKQDKPTDRDSFRFKRIEVTGALLYDLFLEYYKLQLRQIRTTIDKEYYYHQGTYQTNFTSLIEGNYTNYFQDRIVEEGIRKAFKGNWGAHPHTKRLGVVQDINRLSFFSFISQLRKINLPIDSTAKVVKPRLLNSTQWGIICPVHTPDGGNIGFHKYMAISAFITPGCSSTNIGPWLRKHGLRLIEESSPEFLSQHTKVFVNGGWTGIITEPIELIKTFKIQRRNGLISIYNSISWDFKRNEIHIFTDSGRLSRPIFYVDNNEVSYMNSPLMNILKTEKDFSWKQLITGFSPKKISHSLNDCKIYEISELYDIIEESKSSKSTLSAESYKFLNNHKAIIDMLDTAESEGALISIHPTDFTNKRHTHVEIHPSLILSVMGNMIIYPENNQLPRDLFSCGQSKQAVSLYSSNYRNRIDKMSVILNYGQIPLVKSRYLDYITKEQHPYGENAIVAIMSYTGYNVEDALIFNEASVKRGIFRTTYFSMYEAREESSKVGGTTVDEKFCDVQNTNVIGQKPGYDYAYLNKYGIIKEETKLNDKIIVIGKCSNSLIEPGTFIDMSVAPKKGQLGFVDKTFVTDGEEGFRIAKVRIREERVPSIGDKFCSRAGQKGTIGIILPEEDMPFTEDGIRPDVIVNPHALPSRMTIGHLVECLVGKACVKYGGFGDCTAFVNKGPQNKVFGDMLTEVGYHSSGNQLLYNGMTGEQLETNIFFGPNYYLRLKHMVKDKINYRARGPITQMTRQPVHGRAKDGGLRVGEMDRDAIIAHGMSTFLQESMLVRSDDYYMAICNKSGTIAIYNERTNLFLSPLADGPIKFNGELDGKLNIENISKFGKDFSVIRVPYTFKLLLQELKTMNISMRIITEENIDQLTSLSYSSEQFTLNTGYESYNNLITEYKNITEEHIPGVKYVTPISDTPEGLAPTPVFSPHTPEGPAPTPGFSPHTPEGPAPTQVFTPKSPDVPLYKIAIIVPFRNQPLLKDIEGQDRMIHKERFIQHMKQFIPKVSQYAMTEYLITLHIDVMIIEQSDDGRKFNRGALLNSGYINAMKSHYYRGIIFHDVDLLPSDKMIPFYAMGIFNPKYTKSDKKIIHLAHNWGRYASLGTGYIGGVTMFETTQFNNINGFPNYFEGWGGEDDALRERIVAYAKEINKEYADKDDNTILTDIVDYPPGIPEDSYTDLEGVDTFREKRDILKGDEALDNKLKREGRALDKKIWKYNGLINPQKYGELYSINDVSIENTQYQMRKINISLNSNLTSLKVMNDELGSLSHTALQMIDLTPKLYIQEDIPITTAQPMSSPAKEEIVSPYAPSPYAPSTLPSIDTSSISTTPHYTPPTPPNMVSSSSTSTIDDSAPHYTPPTPPSLDTSVSSDDTGRGRGTDSKTQVISIDTSDIKNTPLQDVTDLIDETGTLNDSNILTDIQPDVISIDKNNKLHSDTDTKKIIT